MDTPETPEAGSRAALPMEASARRQVEAAYPALRYLFSAYFHQDWDIEGEDSAAVVRRFVRADPGLVSETRRELERLLACGLTEFETRRLVWSGLGCDYSPLAFGVEMREWLTELHFDLLRREQD